MSRHQDAQNTGTPWSASMAAWSVHHQARTGHRKLQLCIFAFHSSNGTGMQAIASSSHVSGHVPERVLMFQRHFSPPGTADKLRQGQQIAAYACPPATPCFTCSLTLQAVLHRTAQHHVRLLRQLAQMASRMQPLSCILSTRRCTLPNTYVQSPACGTSDAYN